jgi:hypothetical protein
MVLMDRGMRRRRAPKPRERHKSSPGSSRKLDEAAVVGKDEWVKVCALAWASRPKWRNR